MMKSGVLIIMCLILILWQLSLLHNSMAGDWTTFCDPECARRCSKASEQTRCLKYRGICCAKCHCVPSGTYDHMDECPCYRHWKNKKGGHKCP